MPYHTQTKKNSPMKKNSPLKKNKDVKMPKPIMKPRKELSKGQKELMKEHKPNHTPAHNKNMVKLMKMGYCFQQAHDLTMKQIGK
tara:strand:+ start:285 stop:539 length:255 start_codon:yes stop_codon:yes gene_type:complete